MCKDFFGGGGGIILFCLCFVYKERQKLKRVKEDTETVEGLITKPIRTAEERIISS